MEYSLGPGGPAPPDHPWSPLTTWDAANLEGSVGDLWIQAPVYLDGTWTPDSRENQAAIRLQNYLYVFWDDAYYNAKDLDLFLHLWSPEPDAIRIWYVEKPGGPEYYRFTTPVPIDASAQWDWVRLPVPGHSGDGNGGDLARLEGFQPGLLLGGMTARLHDGRVRFSLPKPTQGLEGIWVQSIDGAGLPSIPGFLALCEPDQSTQWILH